MIYTLTLNPALDVTFEVGRLEPGRVVRAEGTTVCAGGKGINVARAITKQGGRAKAVIFSGGIFGEKIKRLLRDEKIDFTAVETKCETRESVQIAENSGRFTNVNGVGEEVSGEELRRIVETLDGLVGKGDVLVMSGSLPRGVPDNIYAELTARFKSRGALVAVDADGAALEAAVAQKPFIIKPNEFELSRLIGRELADPQAAAEAARRLAGKAAEMLLLTMGDKGAFAFTADRQLFLPAKRVKAVSTVGAGDSFLGGFLAAFEKGLEIERCLEFAVATSAAKVTLKGTLMPCAEEVKRMLGAQ